MGVLIEGIGMPVFEHQSLDIRKGKDGKWYMVDTNVETSDGEWHEIVSVPPHGRLGDLDTLQEQIDIARNYGMIGKTAHYKLQKLIKEAPTIIPAEEG